MTVFQMLGLLEKFWSWRSVLALWRSNVQFWGANHLANISGTEDDAKIVFRRKRPHFHLIISFPEQQSVLHLKKGKVQHDFQERPGLP